MKKGFTLVEIIISISIILVVGVSTTFFIFNNKNNKELESVTKEILEAANLYANTEKDESGNIYLNEVRNGKKGIKIPLTNLVSKGYIDESLEKQVKELTNEDNYYVMLLDGIDESIDYCNDGSILTLASWIDEDKNKDIYLCNNSSGNNLNILEGYSLKHELLGISYENYVNNYGKECPVGDGTILDDCTIINNIEHIENRCVDNISGEVEDRFYTYSDYVLTDDYTADGEYVSTGRSYLYFYVPKDSGIYACDSYEVFNDASEDGYTYFYFAGNTSNNYIVLNYSYNYLFRILGFRSNDQTLDIIPDEYVCGDLSISEYTEDNIEAATADLLDNHILEPSIIYSDSDSSDDYKISFMNDYLYNLIYSVEKSNSDYTKDKVISYMYTQDCLKEKFENHYPIISINLSKFNYSGIGTKDSPYVLSYKVE